VLPRPSLLVVRRPTIFIVSFSLSALTSQDYIHHEEECERGATHTSQGQAATGSVRGHRHGSILPFKCRATTQWYSCNDESSVPPSPASSSSSISLGGDAPAEGNSYRSRARSRSPSLELPFEEPYYRPTPEEILEDEKLLHRWRVDGQRRQTTSAHSE